MLYKNINNVEWVELEMDVAGAEVLVSGLIELEVDVAGPEPLAVCLKI